MTPSLAILTAVMALSALLVVLTAAIALCVTVGIQSSPPARPTHQPQWPTRPSWGHGQPAWASFYYAQQPTPTPRPRPGRAPLIDITDSAVVH